MKTLFFLVMMGWNSGTYMATSGAVVMPQPYSSLAECEAAALSARRADKNEQAARYIWLYCVPAPAKAGVSQ